MASQKKLFLTLGHEFIHVFHYAKFKENFNRALSEHDAYQWSIDASDVNNWTDEREQYKDIRNSKWSLGLDSYNYLGAGIQLKFK